jgi:hypothetical protein
MDETNSKQLCQMKTTSTWMKITNWMKYLNEHEKSINFFDDKWK